MHEQGFAAKAACGSPCRSRRSVRLLEPASRVAASVGKRLARPSQPLRPEQNGVGSIGAPWCGLRRSEWPARVLRRPRRRAVGGARGRRSIWRPLPPSDRSGNRPQRSARNCARNSKRRGGRIQIGAPARLPAGLPRNLTPLPGVATILHVRATPRRIAGTSGSWPARRSWTSRASSKSQPKGRPHRPTGRWHRRGRRRGFELQRGGARGQRCGGHGRFGRRQWRGRGWRSAGRGRGRRGWRVGGR